MGLGLTGEISLETAFDSKKNKIIATAMGEFGGESYEGKKAGMSVILNRLDDKKNFPAGLNDFDAYEQKTTLYKDALEGNLTGQNQSSLNDLSNIYDELQDKKKRLSYDFFANLDVLEQPPEFHYLADESEKIGNHTFYKLPDRTGQIKKIQKGLKDKGFNPGLIDGIKGRKTDKALIEFQGSKSLKKDAIPGKNTLKELLGFINIFGVKEASASEGGLGLTGDYKTESGGLGLEGDLDPIDPRDDLSLGDKFLTSSPVEAISSAVSEAIKFFKKDEEVSEVEKQTPQLRSAGSPDALIPVSEEERQRRLSEFKPVQSTMNLYSGVPSYLNEFAQGILPIRPKELQQTNYENPIARSAGLLTGIIATGGLTGGVAPAVSGAKYLETLPKVAQIVAGRMAQTGTTFGVKTLADNMALAIGGEDVSITEAAKETIKSAGFGAGLGVVGAIPSPLLRIPAEASYGFATAKMEGADNLEAGLQAGMFGLFGMFNTKNLSIAYKNAAEQGAKKAMVDRLVRLGANEGKAVEITERYFRYAYSKTGGYDAQKIKNFDEFRKVMRKDGKILLPEEGIVAKARKSKVEAEAYQEWQQQRALLDKPLTEKEIATQKVPLHPSEAGKAEAKALEKFTPDETDAYQKRLQEMATDELVATFDEPLHPAPKGTISDFDKATILKRDVEESLKQQVEKEKSQKKIEGPEQRLELLYDPNLEEGVTKQGEGFTVTGVKPSRSKAGGPLRPTKDFDAIKKDLEDISDFTSDAQKGGELYGGEEGKLRAKSGNLPSVQAVGGPKEAQKILDKAIKDSNEGKNISGSAQGVLAEWRSLQNINYVEKKVDEEINQLKSLHPEITDQEIAKIQREVDQEDLWDEERIERASEKYIVKKEGVAESKGDVVPKEEVEPTIFDRNPEDSEKLKEASDYIDRVTKTQGRLLEGGDLLKGYKSTHKENRVKDEEFFEIWLDKNVEEGKKIESEKNQLEEKKEVVKKKENESLKDFGEKIGGARKDTAMKGGKKTVAKKKTGGWRDKYEAVESVYEGGGWSILDKGGSRFSAFSRQKFASKEDAEQSIPLYAVSKSHVVYKRNDKFNIFKRVGKRKLFKVVNKDFDSREEAMKHMATNAENILDIKTTFGEEILPVPEIAKREGIARRETDADAEMFMNTFSPRGIEFGNWNNQEERQLVLNHAYDGLLDLADVLGVSPKTLMLNGELGVAFGARGQGLSGAKAHFEPSYFVINLTKMKGAGSLAHEWFHALDNYLARLEVENGFEREANEKGFKVLKGKETFLSEGARRSSKLDEKLIEAYQDLVNSMFKKAEKYVEDTQVADKFLSKAREQLKKELDGIRTNLSKDLTQEYTWRKNKRGLAPASEEHLAEFNKLADVLMEGGDLKTEWKHFTSKQSTYGKLRYTNDTLEKMNVIIKAVRNREGFNKESGGSLDKVVYSLRQYDQRLQMFEDAKNSTEKIKQVPTDFAIEAKKMDQARTGDYWSTPPEMAARAFASYVEDKIAQAGGQSDFLVYHAHGGIFLPMIDGFIARPYPEGKERGLIKRTFDEFVKKMKGFVWASKPTNISNKKGQVTIPFEWEANIPIKSASGDAFQDHVDYFENLQLPEDSKIRTIKKEMKVVNGKRLSGKISISEANRKIQRLRGDLIREAVAEGVSIIRTSKGKLKLGMREQSGVFVPADFSEYGKFKNFEQRLGGIVDTSRMFQEIDGSLSVREKAGTEGQAGPVERYIGWRTRDISIQKMNFNEQWSVKLNDIFRGVKPDSKEDHALTQALNSGENTGLSSFLGKKADALRGFYDELLDNQNALREMRGQDLIPFRRNYSPQMLADAVVWGELFNKHKGAGDIQADVFIPDYVMPNKPYNPREMARKGDMPYDLMLKSSYELAKRYLETAEKDIFNTSIIQNNKAFISQLESLGKGKASHALATWNAEGYAGVKASIDRVFNLPESVNKTLRYTNAIRNLAVFPWRFAFNTGNQIKSLSFTIARYGYLDTMNGLLQYMNPKNREQLRGIYSYRVKTMKAGRVSKQDNNNTLDGIIDEKRSAVDRWNDAGTFILEEMEKLLTGSSIFAAYNQGGRRGLKGEALNQFASDGGGKTQSMYNNEDRPGILRNLVIKSIAPYQTFKFELLNSIRELAGRTGTPPDDKREAVAMLLRFVSGAIIMRLIADWASKKDFREFINPMPFAQWTTDPIVDTAIGKKQYGYNNALPSFTGMATELTDGVVKSVKNKNVDRKLRNALIKYVPGMFGIGGGMAASNAVDTLIAYSQGGLYDRSGKLKFRVEQEDIIRGMYSGIWTTVGGREYKEKKFVQPKILRDIAFRHGVFGRKRLYPTTQEKFDKLPESMKKGKDRVLLKTEKTTRTVIFIDTPEGKKKYEKILSIEKQKEERKSRSVTNKYISLVKKRGE